MVDAEIITKVREYGMRVRKRLPVKNIILFGSYVKGTATSESDIDVAIVVEKLPDEDFLDVGADLMMLRQSIDLRIEPHLLSEEEDREGMLEEVKSSGKIID